MHLCVHYPKENNIIRICKCEHLCLYWEINIFLWFFFRIDNEVATQFTIDACQYFANFNCEETCGICNLCDQPGFDSNRPECSTQCAGGEVKCTKSCKAGQEQCLLLASRFSDAATGIIP